MFGCCGFDRTKFKNKDGQIDQERLAKVEDSARKAGWSEKQLERVRTCGCPCHTDGIHCMC